MSLAIGLCGWGVALFLVPAIIRQRRRCERAVRACHELRGAATAIGLVAAALGREPGGPSRALPFEAQLDRLRAGLDDLELARTGRRAPALPAGVPLERMLRGVAAGWRPAARADGRGLRVRCRLGDTAVRVDRGRLAQALGNLLSNALEHGSGTVELLGRRSGDRVLVEVRDQGSRSEAPRRPGRGRGRGLGITADAVEEAGGTISLRIDDGATVAALELPVADR